MSIVVGSGVIANRFIDYQLQQNGKYLIFAGNVNDSTIKDISIIDEEEAIISAELATLRDRCFVYFSSCSILDPVVRHSPYVLHKARMEKLVQDSAKNFLIFRLPQLIALSDTSSSLVNFIVNSIINQEKFELWQNSWRNLIDIDDVHEIVGLALRREVFSNKIIH
jgi:nucleoside-diphosphate-sugar epimerase